VEAVEQLVDGDLSIIENLLYYVAFTIDTGSGYKKAEHLFEEDPLKE